MTTKKEVLMNDKESDRFGIMQQIDEKHLTIRRASERLCLSIRQTKRIRKRYLSLGKEGLVSARRGKASANKTPGKVRERVVELLKTTYLGFGPLLASEQLKKRDQIILSAETIRKWMIEEGLRRPKKRKEKRVYQRRARRERFGELIQGDGSPHDWFEGRDNKCTLLQFVDDSTGKITAARFVPTETTEGYLELLKEHIINYGKPLALYVDKHSIFRVNQGSPDKEKGRTRFGAVVDELDIELICAHSPQAKGRVERKHGLMQDRLTKELRLRSINNIEKANEFLPIFVQEMNDRFGKVPLNQEDAHRPLGEGYDFKKILMLKETRKLSKNLTFQHRGVLYMIETKTPNRMKYATVEVLSQDGVLMEICYKGTTLRYKKFSEYRDERPRICDSKEIEVMSCSRNKKSIPSRYHPWR